MLLFDDSDTRDVLVQREQSIHDRPSLSNSSPQRFHREVDGGRCDAAVFSADIRPLITTERGHRLGQIPPEVMLGGLEHVLRRAGCRVRNNQGEYLGNCRNVVVEEGDRDEGVIDDVFADVLLVLGLVLLVVDEA